VLSRADHPSAFVERSTLRARPAQVSFANSICTNKGGTHVNYVVDQITK
jgi:DNA gyrase/topoisomerase IV subunit B